MKASLVLKMGQQLTMTPQLQQAIRLLQMSTLDLQAEIQEALDSNPMLEVEDDNNPSSSGSQNTAQEQSSHTQAAEPSEATENTSSPAETTDWTEQIPSELEIDTSWDDIYQSSASNIPSSCAQNLPQRFWAFFIFILYKCLYLGYYKCKNDFLFRRRTMITFYEYPKCTTCRKGKKFLTENDLDFTVIDMVKHVPSRDTLKGILDKSSHSIDDFFNTRGTKFKDLGLKEKLPELSEEEKLEYLSSDGMLIKRPIVVLDDEVLLGFKEETYKNALLK